VRLRTWKKAMGWKEKKKNERKHFGHLATFLFSTFSMLLAPLGVLFAMKTRRWTVGCYNGL